MWAIFSIFLFPSFVMSFHLLLCYVICSMMLDAAHDLQSAKLAWSISILSLKPVLNPFSRGIMKDVNQTGTQKNLGRVFLIFVSNSRGK